MTTDTNISNINNLNNLNLDFRSLTFERPREQTIYNLILLSVALLSIFLTS